MDFDFPTRREGWFQFCCQDLAKDREGEKRSEIPLAASCTKGPNTAEKEQGST